jgi:hypothetical protein
VKWVDNYLTIRMLRLDAEHIAPNTRLLLLLFAVKGVETSGKALQILTQLGES